MPAPEPWRIAVIGNDGIPEINRRVFRRLRVLQNDWPKAVFHVVTGTTGEVSAAAQRAARRIGMRFTVVADVTDMVPERYIAFWDFRHRRTADLIRAAILDELHVEVYDLENEPAGAAAAEKVQGIR